MALLPQSDPTFRPQSDTRQNFLSVAVCLNSRLINVAYEIGSETACYCTIIAFSCIINYNRQEVAKNKFNLSKKKMRFNGNFRMLVLFQLQFPSPFPGIYCAFPEITSNTLCLTPYPQLTFGLLSVYITKRTLVWNAQLENILLIK